MSKGKGKKLNQFQHALLRPDTYIGSIITTKSNKYVWSESKECFVRKEIKFNKGLFNIIREIGSNAIDNKWRSEGSADSPKMTQIVITLNTEIGSISVWNDGYCIPARKETYKYEDYRSGKTLKEKLYPAETFFGDMLAGTNFEDDEDRKTSGKNGMGAKAANVFSTEFTVEHLSPDDGKLFKQTYTNNGKNRTTPDVKSSKKKKGYTCITFTPDYERFSYPSSKKPGMDSTLVAVINTYAYEIAMVTGIKVVFNVDEKSSIIKVPSLDKYARLFFPDTKTHKAVSFKANNGDECVLIDAGNSEYDQTEDISSFSYVNGINTSKGGVHVNEWRDAIIKPFVKTFNARKPKKGEPKLTTSAKDIYPYLLLFVRIEMNVRPDFDSQTKEELTGPDYHIYDKKSKQEVADFKKALDINIKKMLGFQFVETLEDKLLMKLDRTLSKKVGKKTERVKSEKLNDANEAGGKRSLECTLWVSEGDSAKTLVVAGISCIPDGSDLNGAYPVRGKFINVQNHTRRQIAANKEAQELMKILGLVPGADYSIDSEFQKLRYGRCMIATDVDDDGIHIRGLIINFIYSGWPELVKRGFIRSLSTAVVRAWIKPTKGNKLPKNVEPEMLFWSNPEYSAFKSKIDNSENPKYRIADDKYYKGLGTIEPEYVPQFFENPQFVKYFLEGDEVEYMDLGFHKEASDQRKEWLIRGRVNPLTDEINDDEDAFVEPDFVYNGKLGLSTFVDHQLIIYHKMTLTRSLPNVMDGFKESQRKIYFGIREKNYAKPVKVATVAGAIQEITAYHHGETSLGGATTKMAQGFVGSRNIPLLKNVGQFGSRLLGGEDASAPRYIFTNIEEVSNFIFRKEDNAILKRLVDDNQEIEYEEFAPVIPMLLVNGANGIACGFSTDIPCYNPKDLVHWIRTYLEDPSSADELAPLVPWYRGFTGEIKLGEKTVKGKVQKYWSSKGILTQDKRRKNVWHITELPIGMWTQTMKIHLDYLTDGHVEGKKWPKRPKCLKKVKEYNTLNTVHFEITAGRDFIPDMDTPHNLKNMQKTSSLMNMVAIVDGDYPIRFTSPEQILKYFCSKRLPIYLKRQEYLLKLYKGDLKKARNKYNYIKYINDKSLNLHQPDDKVDEDMKSLKLDKLITGKNTKPTYDYLLDMATRSLTEKRMTSLKKEVETLKQKITDLKKKTPTDLWLSDLDDFEKAYKKFLKTRMEESKQKKRTNAK